MEIPVLGCGPAGLLVAYAVRLNGHTPVIHSRKVKSRLHGAQYLHHEIPGMAKAIPSQVLAYDKIGTKEGYALKIYGDMFAPTSWEKFSGHVQAWSLRSMYEWLWSNFEDDIVEIDVDHNTVRNDDRLIFSTIPRRALYADCGEFTWHEEQVYVEDLGYRADWWTPVGAILYVGLESIPWYRESYIFGCGSREYPSFQSLPPGALASRVTKPVSTTAPEIPGVHMFGRYGKWQKGVLVDHAFNEAMEILSRL